MTKNESAERAARDKKSQDNKDRLKAEDKQRRSEANEMNDGVPLIVRIIRKALIGALILIAVLLFATFLGEAILYLSSALSWVSYPFYFLFGNADFFDLKSLTAGSQFDGGGLKGLDDMLVLSGQFWLDFLILLVVSVIAVFIFYKIINFKNKTTRTRNISLAVIVYIVGSFITTNTNYIGNGLINKDVQYVAKSFPSFAPLKEEFEKSERERAKLDAIEAKKKAKLDAIEAKKKAKKDAEQRALNSKKAKKIMSLAPNYDAHAKKLNAAINSQSTQRDINFKFEEVVTSEIKRLGDDANLNHLDVSNITSMEGLFKKRGGEYYFNGDISGWDVSNVRSMRSMFRGSRFNGDISGWYVSNVTDMGSMFAHSKFNGDISKWDVGKVTSMWGMFFVSPFNGDISKWDVSNVTDMDGMFRASPFNGDISNWSVSNVTKMGSMFGDSRFNGDISEWDVSSVTDMRRMFKQSRFNGDISEWDVSSVTDMRRMFKQSRFNGDISGWAVKPEGYKRK
jgi:surface protein